MPITYEMINEFINDLDEAKLLNNLARIKHIEDKLASLK